MNQSLPRRERHRDDRPRDDRPDTPGRARHFLGLLRLLSVAMFLGLLALMAMGVEARWPFVLFLGLALIFEALFWSRLFRRRRGPKIDTRPPEERGTPLD